MDILDWLRGLFALIATVSLIGLAAYAARRFGMLQPGGPGAGHKRMKVVESLMLDPRRRLVLVRLDGRDHMLLLSPAGDRAITDVEARDPLPEAPPLEARP